MEIHGASALVTGGASGLGEATATALAAAGSHVVIVDQNSARAAAVAGRIGGSFTTADVAEENQIQAAVALAVERGPLRVLVNCAGISRPARTVSRAGKPFDYGVFKRVIDVNLLGTFNCLRLAAAVMVDNEPDASGQRGLVVNTASSAAFEGQVGQSAYSASKGGIVAMTLPIARDLAIFGIRVNTISPGLFDTPIFEGGEEIKAKLLAEQLFPTRAGHPDEFAQLVLAAVANDYLNGSVIRLDGGARLPVQ
jgi:NAD(P)-dependent dehydrogenase (short-subunit alcohol dehydrogenase family)